MYERSATYYDILMSPHKDYAKDCRQIRRWIKKYCPGPKTLLDIACGTGRHLEHLRKYYDVQGLDINPEFLRIARRRCPGVPFHRASMLDFRLSSRFDAITCLFSSIAHVKTLTRLHRAIRNMARHLHPGGILVIEPWFTPARYWVDYVKANYVDEADLKIAWMYVTRIRGRVSVWDNHFLVATPQGCRHFVEREEVGLFTQEEYVGAFARAGLDVVEVDPVGLTHRGMYIARRPLATRGKVVR